MQLTFPLQANEAPAQTLEIAITSDHNRNLASMVLEPAAVEKVRVKWAEPLVQECDQVVSFMQINCPFDLRLNYNAMRWELTN
jgi:hypothetical protein